MTAFAVTRAYAELAKIRISFFAALSASACFMLASGHLTLRCMLVAAGVFLLASGSCALNHYQEKDTDSLMPRTAGRPIPSQRTKPASALAFSLFFMCLGSIVLMTSGGWKALALGLFAVLWYNGVYVSFKKVSPFSAIPGALTGVAPPVIGWISGGGMLSSPVLGAICLSFFIWQVPHSWLLFLEYGSEYEKAGLPSLTRIWSRPQIIRTTFVWTLSTAVICLILALHVETRYPVLRIALFAAALWLTINSARLVLNDKKNRHAKDFIFGKLNAYLFVVMALLVFSRLTNKG
jgi:protoheme IX farnesyltransferase